MWRELIEKHTPQARFASPAAERALRRAEETLGHLLPDDLAELLGETDGVVDANGYNLVFSVEQLVQGNLEMRTYPALKRLYMAFDQLLFFSDIPGDGSLFAYALVPEGRPDVFVWDHRTDGRRCVAPSLEHFIEAWFGGDIRL
ncbi:SMI1/KNR4 family protein [Actinomadura fibrosa]|uniref:SMI1/KNR4 family protein n=1 Tax=Actinomadura fibrosa TaxID=111802 RepID=A0ABW2XRM0_9ACTN|nr:SMI1/KNR4 family protein [Actinomadura fibrosa]